VIVFWSLLLGGSGMIPPKCVAYRSLKHAGQIDVFNDSQQSKSWLSNWSFVVVFR
jgi:hypothetical protein